MTESNVKIEIGREREIYISKYIYIESEREKERHSDRAREKDILKEIERKNYA